MEAFHRAGAWKWNSGTSFCDRYTYLKPSPRAEQRAEIGGRWWISYLGDAHLRPDRVGPGVNM